VQNAERLRERLAELSPPGRLCRWDGGDGAYGGASGRGFALPHIKTFCRYRASDGKLAWAILASHNLSQAAWGKAEKHEQQLYIKSFELGVLLLPSLQPTPHALYASTKAARPPPPAGALIVPVPYALPPPPYGAHDVPWSTSDGQHAPRWAYTIGADRHGREIGQPHGGFYGAGSWAQEVQARARVAARASR
jgi:hypothetical protein